MILRQNLVEPGDAAPPGGEPFAPENNFDQPLAPGLQLLVRGPKATLINTTSLTDEEALQEVSDSIAKVNEIVPDALAEAKRVGDARRAAKQAEEEARVAAMTPAQRERHEAKLAAREGRQPEAASADYNR